MPEQMSISPVGKLLKHWRGVRRRSQLELALEANVSARHVSFIETGRSRPSREMVLQLAEVLPGLDLAPLEATSFRVDRAEAATEGGRRPETQSLLIDGNTITAWPTKLALAPALAAQVAGVLDRMAPPAVPGVSVDLEAIDWPRPEVAQPPWETATDWLPVMAAAASRQAA